jgi:hypothetical protein
MSITYRIRPGDDLEAVKTQQNFDDLESLVNTNVGSLQVEEGAVHTRHCETATAFKDLGVATTTTTTNLGSLTRILPSSASAFTTFAGQAFLVRAVETTGSTPHCELHIKIGSTTVIQRYWQLISDSKQVIKIAWMAVASGSSTTIEVHAEGSNADVTKGTLSVLAITR